jgi:hypothetical protein
MSLWQPSWIHIDLAGLPEDELLAYRHPVLKKTSLGKGRNSAKLPRKYTGQHNLLPKQDPIGGLLWPESRWVSWTSIPSNLILDRWVACEYHCQHVHIDSGNKGEPSLGLW